MPIKARIIKPRLNHICAFQDNDDTKPPHVQLNLLPELIIYIRYNVNIVINPKEAIRPIFFVNGIINKALIIISTVGISQAILELKLPINTDLCKTVSKSL